MKEQFCTNPWPVDAGDMYTVVLLVTRHGILFRYAQTLYAELFKNNELRMVALGPDKDTIESLPEP